MWLAIGLSFVILLLLAVIGFLAKALTVQVKRSTVYEQWIVELQNKVNNVYETITSLDDKQMFAKDDDVGAVFQEMVELVKSLNEKTTV
jgi:hypothetical protein